MSQSVHRHNLARSLDRSKCVFPTSAKTSNVPGRRSIRTELLTKEDFLLSVNVPATLKAAWVLTLQCFIVADVFCFGFNGPDPVNREPTAQESKSVTGLYVMRINRSETVRSLVTRLGLAEGDFIQTQESEDYEINVVGGGSLDHQCNTTIYYSEDSDQHNQPEPLDSLENRVTISTSGKNSHVSLHSCRPI